MSDEFYACTDQQVSQQTLARCIDELASNQRYEIESLTSEEVKLRYKGETRRDNWPEDITITLEPQRLYVAIHVGTSKQRRAFVDDFSEAFTLEGVPLTLTEV